MLHLHATSKPSPTINRKEEPAEDLGGESPLHTVYVSAFYMDEYLVTKSLWDAVKAWNAGNGYSYDYDGSAKAGTHPVQTVDWYDVVKWCNARSKMEGLTPCYYTNSELTEVYKIGQVRNPYVNWSANGYRLPTEAEWEKAARGGVSGHRFPWPDTDTISQSRANYCSYWSGGIPRYLYDVNSTNGYHPTFNDGVVPYTSPVGYFPANGYGLYDMAGNVWEWCWDWFLFTYYSTSPQTDPRGPADGA
jgi:formylglycine-generating enzyme required for sulfatase activity